MDVLYYPIYGGYMRGYTSLLLYRKKTEIFEHNRGFYAREVKHRYL